MAKRSANNFLIDRDDMYFLSIGGLPICPSTKALAG